MQKVMLFFIMLFCTFSLTSCSLAADAVKDTIKADAVKDTIKEEMSTDSTASNSTATSIMQSKVNLLSWKIKYWKAYQKTIELEYTGACYKDKRHNAASVEIEKLNKELRKLLIGG